MGTEGRRFGFQGYNMRDRDKGRITRDGTLSAFLQLKIFLQASLNYSARLKEFFYGTHIGEIAGEKKATPKERERGGGGWKEKVKVRAKEEKRLVGLEGLIVDSGASAIGLGNPTKVPPPTPATKPVHSSPATTTTGVVGRSLKRDGNFPNRVTGEYCPISPSRPIDIRISQRIAPLFAALTSPRPVPHATTIFLIAIVRR